MRVVQIDDIAFMRHRVGILSQPLHAFLAEGAPSIRRCEEAAERVLRKSIRPKHDLEKRIFVRKLGHLIDSRAAGDEPDDVQETKHPRRCSAALEDAA